MTTKPTNYEIYSKEEIRVAVEAYNEGARWWNSIPGNKLKWPEDKFVVRYCECKKKYRTGEDKRGVYCYGCGYYIIGE